MNYGGDAADQIVRYSMEGLDHTLRLSGTMAKNLAVFFAAVLKDQKKTHGKTKMIRMLKENRPFKFFSVPTERLREFCSEGKKRGLLYVIIKDRKNPELSEVMVFADDASKVNRVLDKMNLDFVKAESGGAAHEVQEAMEQTAPVQTETVQMPEGDVQFEISDMEDLFNFEQGAKQGTEAELGNFTQAQEAEKESPFEPSSRSRDTSTVPDEEKDKPSVRKELQEIQKEKAAERKENTKKRERGRSNRGNRSKKKTRRKTKTKAR